MKLGEKMRLLRKRTHGYTLTSVSEATGLSVSFLSDVERGRTKPSLDTLEKLARLYRISIDDLLQGVDWETFVPPSVDLPGFAEFLLEMEKGSEPLKQDVLDIVLRAEQRSTQRARTKEDWKQYYYTLKTVMRR